MIQLYVGNNLTNISFFCDCTVGCWKSLVRFENYNVYHERNKINFNNQLCFNMINMKTLSECAQAKSFCHMLVTDGKQVFFVITIKAVN